MRRYVVLRRNLHQDAHRMWQVLDVVKDLAIRFLDAAEEDIHSLETNHGLEAGSAPYRPVLESRSGTDDLSAALPLSLPFAGLGAKDLKATTKLVVEHSVNTSSPSFLDKLWSSPSIPGIAADLLISSLNGNSHVFRVSPALTLVEKHVGSELASLFGLRGPYSGGVTMPGGAASNTTALLIARNVRFPETKDGGVAALLRPLAVFVSESAHYSATLAAQIVGLGAQAVRKVATTAAGTMDPTSLRRQLDAAVKAGHIPLFVEHTIGCDQSAALLMSMVHGSTSMAVGRLYSSVRHLSR
jgi:glutamate decarboxylase